MTHINLVDDDDGSHQTAFITDAHRQEFVSSKIEMSCTDDASRHRQEKQQKRDSASQITDLITGKIYQTYAMRMENNSQMGAIVEEVRGRDFEKRSGSYRNFQCQKVW
jgi:hypothetical protein